MTTFPPVSVAAARPAQYAPAPMATSNAPPGTFAPGTKVLVGSHRVVIEKYLSEGGFAHVYVVHVPTASGSTETAVLKRVAVPDKENLANMRTEVETMKKLKGHRHIVTYIDSHASQLKGGGYEVFLLMEYCEGGGLIDFMNTRLKHRLTEPEILKIFSDAAEGVACMHYLKPPLLHRDLKVENILISQAGGSKYYKLCDFGSTAPPRPAATTAAEGRLIEDDVQRHTTLQYRSPEMIDVYRKRPIDEKSDIWALGVLLYKLCYYTTPFEEQGQMAILKARFRFPAYPVFSDRLKALIATMLTEDPQNRPNIYQVLRDVCAMRGKQVPIKDIYANRTHSEVRNNQHLPSSVAEVEPPPTVGAVHESPVQPRQTVPEITPMRRGRPATTSRPPGVAQPGSSPGPKTEKDPFAALDSTSSSIRAAAVDELAARFPALDDFSLLQDKSSGFQFNAAPASDAPQDKSVAIALADEVFAQSAAPQRKPALRADVARAAASAAPQESTKGRKQHQSEVAQKSVIKQTMPIKPTMVSTGTMTSRPSSPRDMELPVNRNRPIWRVPTPPRDRPSISESTPASVPHRGATLPKNMQNDVRSAQSSRPSLENLRTPSLGISDSVHRSKSLDNQSRSDGNAQSTAHGRSPDRHASRTPREKPAEADAVRDEEVAVDDSNIESNVEFLRAMEEEGASKSHHRRKSSLFKSASIPAISLSNTKSMLAGKFGEAFRRFEAGGTGQRSTSPDGDPINGSGRLSPVTASENTGPPSVVSSVLDETEDLSPEMRRELERRRLSQEERRVTEAAALYRQQFVTGEGKPKGATSRASAIQDRVKSLLDDSGRASPVRRTAEGYGKYTNIEGADSPPATRPIPIRVPGGRKPVEIPAIVPASAPPVVQTSVSQGMSAVGPVELTRAKTRNPSGRPSAPPKPVALRTGGVGIGQKGGSNVPAEPSPHSQELQADVTSEDLDSFSKRYPSLSLELVETEIADVQSQAHLRMRDV